MKGCPDKLSDTDSMRSKLFLKYGMCLVAGGIVLGMMEFGSTSRGTGNGW